MGTTSEKLSYLNTTKEKIRDSINLTGANLTSEDTFRSYASKLKKGYIDIINNGIDTLYNNFPKVSGIGSNLSLTPTYEAPMKLNEIQGSTLQNGTPTPDTPVPIQSVTGLQNVNITGKNLLPINQIQSQTINGLTITNLGDGTIKVNGTANTTTRLDVTYTKPLKANTPYIFSNANIRASSNANINIQDSDNNVLGIITLNVATNTYTPTTDVTIAKMRFYIDSGQSFDNYILKVQLEQGSTATTYEPYKGNTYEVNLGKNLCNNALFVASSGATINSYTDNSISVTFVGTYKAATQFIDISNSTYTFSIGNISNNKGRMEVYLYNNGEQVGTKQNVTANQTYTIDNTSGLGDQIRLTLSNSDLTQTNEITFNNIQLEKGTQSTSFSPYFTPIELNKIGDYQDRIYKDSGKWYVEKQIGKVVLNGSERWFDWSNNRMVLATLTDYKKVDSSTTSLLMSNYYKAVSRANSQTNNSMCFYGNSDDSFGIIVCDGTNNTSTLLKAWLSTHNTEVLYVLATPEYTEITNTELIEDLETLYTAKSQEGTTNISITSEDLEMILNVSALKGDA